MIDPHALGLSVTSIRGNEARCLCPFHSDHTPSATFNIVTGQFFCFACGETSNVNRLVYELGGYVAPYNAELVAKYSRGAEGREWEWVLSASPAFANSYLEGRGLSDDDIGKFGIREFSDGIAFVLRDMRGAPVGAQLRFYEGSPRYLTLGEKPSLWPMPELRTVGPRNPVVLTEGIFGAIRGRQFGINAFAVIGAASAPGAVRWMNGFSKRGVMFDDDKAGHIAAAKMLALGGWAAFCPGTEADECSSDTWNLMATFDESVCKTYYLDFLRDAGDIGVTLPTVQNFIRRQSVHNVR